MASRKRNNGLAKRDPQDIAIGGITLASTGLIFGNRATFEDWQAAGSFLNRVETGVQWWIGDWLNYGERKYGEKYSQALEATNLEYQTVADAAWVAGKFEFSRRRENLSWSHHKEVAALEPEDADALLDTAGGESWSTRELRRQVVLFKQKALVTPDLPPGVFNLIYADPPWQYDFSLTDNRKIENHYDTMAVDQICALGINGIADPDSVLFLWATSPKLTEAMRVIGAWGFEYKTCMVWRKDKVGMGYYARQQHELLLIATCGNPPLPPEKSRPPSVVDGERTDHSRKPEIFYELIEKMYPKFKKVELFCREPRDGWHAWGNEVNSDQT